MKGKQIYKMELMVPAEMVGTIVELFDGTSGRIVSINATDVPVTEISRNFRYIGGRRNKGISGQALLLQSIPQRGITREDLMKIFTEHGFAKTSVGPILSKLISTKQIIWVAEHGGVYQKKI